MQNSKKWYLVIVAVLLFFAYKYSGTMPSAFENNDSPETALASLTLGVAHPPAYPLFTMLGKIACVFGAGAPIFRANVFSVLLSVLTLFLIFLIAAGTFTGEKYKNHAGLAALFLAGISSLFWEQATDAKGGIYMLNLLFTAACILLAVKIIKEKETKYMYMMAFVYGLSLANHWPSMAVLFPVILAPFIIQRMLINIKTVLGLMFLFLLGLTPYIYLPIRAAAEPALNIGNPVDLQGFLWVVSRQGYEVLPFSFDRMLWQAKEYANLLLTNYEALWVVAVAGIIMMFKKSRTRFYILAGIFLCNSFAVVVLNRNPEQNPEIMRIFLLPGQTVMAVFISFGAVSFFSAPGKLKNTLFAVFCGMFLLIIYLFSYMENSSQRNFAAYDYGKNILKTQGDKSVYMAEGALNLMPVYYLKYAQGYRKETRLVPLNFLYFDWGIAEFEKQYAKTGMKPQAQAENFKEALGRFDDSQVLLGGMQPELLKIAQAKGYEKQNGLLKEKGGTKTPAVYPFYLYSYRGLIGEYLEQKKTSIQTGANYSAALLSGARVCLETGRYADAYRLYTIALAFSNIGNSAAVEADRDKARKLSAKKGF